MPTSILVFAGAAFGVLLGLVIALFREWRRDLVREEEQTEVTGVSIFATLPPNRTGRVVDKAVDPVGHEAYRRLRSGVVANGPRPHVLAVAAVDAQGHSSVVAINLAVALAAARFSVLIVAADPDDRGVERTLGVASSPGLSEVVHDGVSASDVLVRAEGVTVLPGGAKPVSVRELYAGPAFCRVVDSFRSDYDYIILSSSSSGTGDGDAVIAAADSVLLTVTSSRDNSHSGGCRARQVRAAGDQDDRGRADAADRGCLLATERGLHWCEGGTGIGCRGDVGDALAVRRDQRAPVRQRSGRRPSATCCSPERRRRRCSCRLGRGRRCPPRSGGTRRPRNGSARSRVR